MSDSRRRVRALVVLSPLLLTGCDSVPSIDFSAIASLWDKPDPAQPRTAVALRASESDAAVPPEGMQMDDLKQPFGDAAPTVTAQNGP
ncbi:MAG TPA: hypothetical protein VMH86_03465 [Rhizomicrobium sp.]|nr:hypothetical protein [Rhizomicrobium sp.]